MRQDAQEAVGFSFDAEYHLALLRFLATIQEQQGQPRLAIGQLHTFARKISAGLDNADFATKRKIIRGLVKRIEIDREDVRVVYRVSPRLFCTRPR